MEKKLYWSGEWLQNEHIIEGKSITQIAREQGVSDTTIRGHLIKNGIPIREPNHGKKQYPNLEPSPELSYILGVIDGDGSVHGYERIELDVKDYEFAQEFRRALKRIGLRANVIERNNWNKSLKRKWYGFRCYANSVVFVRWFNGLTQEQEEGIASQYPEKYLKGFFESEGACIIDMSGSAHVHFFNTNYDLLLRVQGLLALLGYESKIYKSKFKGYFSGQEKD